MYQIAYKAYSINNTFTVRNTAIMIMHKAYSYIEYKSLTPETTTKVYHAFSLTSIQELLRFG